jgi:hypothetical protein
MAGGPTSFIPDVYSGTHQQEVHALRNHNQSITELFIDCDGLDTLTDLLIGNIVTTDFYAEFLSQIIVPALRRTRPAHSETTE